MVTAPDRMPFAPANALSESAAPVLIALANPRTARALMRVGLAVAAARGAPVVVVSVAPTTGGQLAEATPAVRRLRALVHRMSELATLRGWQVRGVIRAARSVVEGLGDIVREEEAAGDAGALLIVGWPAGEATPGDGLGLIGLLAAAPPCDMLFVRGRVPSRWDTVMLAQRGGPHTRLATEVALDLTRAGGTRVLAPPSADEEVPGAAVLTALHVAPDYLERTQEAVEEAAFSALWTREEPVIARARVVRAHVAADAIVQQSRGQQLLILDAAPTTRAHPFPLGRTVHDVLAGARVGVIVAKSAWSDGMALGSAAPPTAREEPSAAAPLDRWFAEHTFGTREFTNGEELAHLKERLGHTIGVLLLTHDDEETIGPLVRALRSEVGAGTATPLVDEVIVVDGGSADNTIAVARAAGATALDSREVLRAAGSYRGRGETLWKAAAVATSDLLVVLNAAGPGGAARAVCALAGPLLLHPELTMVAGFSRRALRGNLQPGELAGEIAVRPLLNLVFPDLAGLITPVPADYSIRRAALRGLPVTSGDGVEVGLILDVVRSHGLAALAQVDLEHRPARIQDPGTTGRFAFAVTQAVLRRLDQQHTEVRLLGPLHHVLRLPYLREDGYALDSTDVPETERPPLDTYLSTP